MSTMEQFPKILILTWNTRGLLQTAKREAVLRTVKLSKANVIFLQEINATEQHCRQPTTWLTPSFASTFEAFLSRHCAILVRKGLFASLELLFTADRVLHLAAKLSHPIPAHFDNADDQTLNLVCIYANATPADRKEFFSDPHFWETIPNSPSALGNHAAAQYSKMSPASPFTIMAGDFNDFPSFADAPLTPSNRVMGSRHWWYVIDPIMQQKGLVDPMTEAVDIHFNYTSPEEDEDFNDLFVPQFYTRVTPTSSTRIDHVLLSKSLSRVFNASPESYYAKATSTLSDHSQVYLRLEPQGCQSRTTPKTHNPSSSFRLHRHWCSNEKFLQKMRALSPSPPENISEPPWVRWNRFRLEIKEAAAKWTRILSSLHPKEDGIEIELDRAGRRVDQLVQSGQAHTEAFAQARTHLRHCEEKIIDQLRKAFKDNTDAIEEIPRTWALSSLLHQKETPAITTLQDDLGNVARTWEELETVVTDFYSKLYAKPDTDYVALNDVLHKGGRQKVLSKSQCDTLRAPITVEEVEAAIARMNSKSVPGEDGLPLALYEALPELRIELARYGTALLAEGAAATPNSPNILVTLLFKKGLKFLMKNYRPVSLINTGDRILSSVLNARFQSSLAAHAILPPSQSAFVADRNITDGILMMQLFISANLLGLTDTPQAVVLLDQEKAFDRLHPAFTMRALRWYGIPSEIIQFFKKTSAEANARYKLNGSITKQVDLKCGILQGDPVAPLLYNIGTQPFADLLQKQGVVFRYRDVPVEETRLAPEEQERIAMWPQFADDWAPVATAQTSRNLLEGLDLMKRAANIAINPDKTQMFVLRPRSHDGNAANGSANGETMNLPYEPLQPNVEIKYLGSYLRVDGKAPADSHRKVLEGAQRSMHMWHCLGSSWLGAVRLVNTFYTSRIWHRIGAAGALDSGLIAHELYRSINTIIYGKARGFIRLDTLAMPLRHGGLGLVTPRLMLPAMAGRDLAAGLSSDTDPKRQGPGTLFRTCLRASSKEIDEDEGVWLERRGVKWRSDRLKVFQPIWLRYSHAATELNLSVDPETVQDLILMPWWIPDTDPLSIFSGQDRSWLRRGGLRTWNDILTLGGSPNGDQDIPVFRLEAALALLSDTRYDSINGLQKQESRQAWKILHSKWDTFVKALPERWRACLRQVVRSERRTRAPRWLKPRTQWPLVYLPNDLLLAGQPLHKYSIKKGRMYLLQKEIPFRKIPRRHQLQLASMTTICPQNGEVSVERNPFETEGDQHQDELAQEDQRQQEDLSREVMFTHKRDRGLPSFVEQSNLGLDEEKDLLREVDQFWLQLVTSKRIFQMAPDVYSAVFSSYHGSLPTPQIDGTMVICCQGQKGNRQHKLFRCIRAQTSWQHMNLIATTLGIDIADISNAEECCELFPRWRGQITETKNPGGPEEKEVQRQACLKMLLIAIHTYALMPFMTHAVEAGDLNKIIARARRTLADYPIFDTTDTKSNPI